MHTPSWCVAMMLLEWHAAVKALEYTSNSNTNLTFSFSPLFWRSNPRASTAYPALFTPWETWYVFLASPCTRFCFPLPVDTTLSNCQGISKSGRQGAVHTHLAAARGSVGGGRWLSNCLLRLLQPFALDSWDIISFSHGYSIFLGPPPGIVATKLDR